MADRSPAASSPAPSRPVLRSRPLQPMVPATRAPSGPNRARFPGADGGSPSVRTVVPMTTVRPSRRAASTAANASRSIGSPPRRASRFTGAPLRGSPDPSGRTPPHSRSGFLGGPFALLLLLAELVEDAAGQDDLALAGGQVEGGGEAVLALDPDLDLVGPAGHGPAQVGHGELVAHLEPVVGRLVDGEREQPLGDQVAPVDAGEALGQDAAHPEGQRGQGGVLAAGPLAVVLAADDEPAVPVLGPLHEPRVLLH